MKIMNKIESMTRTWKKDEVLPSISADIEGSVRKLNICKQREERNSKEGN